MSQQYILNRLMQTGGGCGCGSESSQFGAGCGSESSQFGAGCGNNFEGGGELTFVFFDSKSLDKEWLNKEGHIEFHDINGKKMRILLDNIQSFENTVNKTGQKGYIDEKALYRKLFQKGFKGVKGQKRVELIEPIMEIAKKSIKNFGKDIMEKLGSITEKLKTAAKKAENGLYIEADDLAVEAVFAMFQILSDTPRDNNVSSARNKFFEKVGCKPETAHGGSVESYDDVMFMNSIFGGYDMLNLDSQDGGAIYLPTSYLTHDSNNVNVKEKLNSIINEINKAKNTEKLKHKVLGNVADVNTVLVIEVRPVVKAKIYGLYQFKPSTMEVVVDNVSKQVGQIEALDTPKTQPKPSAPVAQPKPSAPVAQPKPSTPVAQPKPSAPVLPPVAKPLPTPPIKPVTASPAPPSDMPPPPPLAQMKLIQKTSPTAQGALPSPIKKAKSFVSESLASITTDSESAKTSTLLNELIGKKLKQTKQNN